MSTQDGDNGQQVKITPRGNDADPGSTSPDALGQLATDRAADNSDATLSPSLIIISAMTHDHVIGNEAGDGMPWNVPEEFNKFLEFVRGQAVIMGRKSYDIFAGDLGESTVFVVSRSDVSYPHAEVCQSFEVAVQRARATGREVFIAGGGMIYEQALAVADKMYLSYIKGDFTGSVHFPELDPAAWRVTHREDHQRFEFVVYERIR